MWLGEGGLDLVELANTKSAVRRRLCECIIGVSQTLRKRLNFLMQIGRRTLADDGSSSAAEKVRRFGLALLEKANNMDAKLSDLDAVL